MTGSGISLPYLSFSFCSFNYHYLHIGSETIAHLRENGRITILFHAFEGPPRIVRLFGHGIIHEFGTPEYNRYLPGTARTAGSRAVIVIDIDRVGTVRSRVTHSQTIYD
jgi:hypothetical protein